MTGRALVSRRAVVGDVDAEAVRFERPDADAIGNMRRGASESFGPMSALMVPKVGIPLRRVSEELTTSATDDFRPRPSSEPA